VSYGQRINYPCKEYDFFFSFVQFGLNPVSESEIFLSGYFLFFLNSGALICFNLCWLGFQKGGPGSVGIRERVVPAGAEAFVEEHRAAEARRREEQQFAIAFACPEV